MMLSRTRRWACAVGLAASVPGCLPIPYTARVSPRFSGVYLDTAGVPVSGVRLTLSGTAADSACTAALVRATTDSLGTFRLPAARKRQRMIPLNADLAWYPYVLCAGPAGSLRARREGIVASGEVVLDCFEWVWDGRKRTTCASARYDEIFAGGRWTEGAASGWLRAFTARDPGAPERAGVFVQWLAGPGPGHPARVRAIARVPCGPSYCAFDRRRTSLNDTVPTVAVRTARAGGERRRAFALGTPGSLREVSPPPR